MKTGLGNFAVRPDSWASFTLSFLLPIAPSPANSHLVMGLQLTQPPWELSQGQELSNLARWAGGKVGALTGTRIQEPTVWGPYSHAGLSEG